MAISQVGNIAYINQNTQLGAQFQANIQSQINLQAAINIEEFIQQKDENKEVRKTEGVEKINKDSSNSNQNAQNDKQNDKNKEQQTEDKARKNIYSNSTLLDIEV